MMQKNTKYKMREDYKPLQKLFTPTPQGQPPKCPFLIRLCGNCRHMVTRSPTGETYHALCIHSCDQQHDPLLPCPQCAPPSWPINVTAAVSHYIPTIYTCSHVAQAAS